jgi:hypothetical protein
MQMSSENEKNLSIEVVRIGLLRTFQIHEQHEHGWEGVGVSTVSIQR